MKTEYASRKFIDLILSATSKWANWDPLTPISTQVGDYGLIDKETGEFQAQGNIYNESLQERFRSKFNFDLKIEALQPQVQEHGDEEFIAKSWGVTIGLSMHLLERTASVALKVDLEFENSERAAVLVMHKPRYTILPNDERIARLLRTRPDILKGKCIVTQVITCSAYLVYLSDMEAENLSLTLSATGPTLPDVDIGGAAGFRWLSEGASSTFRRGGDPQGKLQAFVQAAKTSSPVLRVD
ncbi:hypothetical protein M405DRAFT_864435 [Rhizopogon salebrosus TDB-379]|nr:hypothetical protein M405DRAFT_864435 [Rhizopogon salebrosus TDB-379]